MAAVITPEHPANPDASALIAELDAHLTPLYRRESRHGFSVERLVADAVAFFVEHFAGHDSLLDAYPFGAGEQYGDVRSAAVTMAAGEVRGAADVSSAKT